MTALRISG
jgi:uncharacterized membrane protein